MEHSMKKIPAIPVREMLSCQKMTPQTTLVTGSSMAAKAPREEPIFLIPYVSRPKAKALSRPMNAISRIFQ